MKKANYILALLMILIAFFVYFYSNTFIEAKSYDLGSAAFPKIISVLTIFLSILLIINTLKERDDKTKEKHEENEQIFNKTGTLRLILGSSIIMIYFFLINKIGFIIATLIFLIVFMRVLGIKKWVMSIPISIVTTFLIYFLFQDILKVQLPSGIWI